MNTFHTDYAYRVAERKRRQDMAVRMTPAGVFWTRYVSFLVIVASLALAYYGAKK